MTGWLSMQYAKHKYTTYLILTLFLVSTVYAEDQHALSAKQTQLMHDVGYSVLTARATKSEKIKSENQPFYDEIKSLRENADSWERAELELNQPVAGTPAFNQSPNDSQSRQKDREEKQRTRDAEHQKLSSAIERVREVRKHHVNPQEQQDDAVLKKLDELQAAADDIRRTEGNNKAEKIANFRSQLARSNQFGGDDSINPENMKPTFRIDVSDKVVKKINKSFVVGGDK